MTFPKYNNSVSGKLNIRIYIMSMHLVENKLIYRSLFNKLIIMSKDYNCKLSHLLFISEVILLKIISRKELTVLN